MTSSPAPLESGENVHVPLWALLPLFLAWMLPGLFGHEPWKPDEGYTIGLINHIVTTGDWVVPTLAGEPFMEKPPIFFITAALFAKLLSPWLMPLHQAAACATLLYIGLTFVFTYLAGKEAAGPRGGLVAMLGLMGCIGFIVRAHSSITDTALWCGFAVACYGMLLAGRRNVAGAFWFGTGAGMAFMAKGFMGPAFIGVAAFLLPVFAADRRGWRYVRMLALSFVFSLPWLVVWPTALYMRSPELFSDWFWLNNIGRFLGPRFGFPALAQARGRWAYITRFPWFTLPLWPAALALWWRKGRQALTETSAVYPTLIAAVGMGLLIMAAGQRELYMIPLLVPIAVVAAKGADALPRWADRALCLVPVVLGTVLLIAVWAVWLGWVLGYPESLAGKMAAFAPGLEKGSPALCLALAIVYTCAWAWYFLIKKSWRRFWPLAWAACLTAFWGTSMLLFLHVLDHGNGYRSTFAAMNAHLPDNLSEPIDAYRFGESQRAILEYYFGRRTRNMESGKPEPAARYLVAQNHRRHERFDPGPGWRVLWEGTRPGDKKEWYVLYRRTADVDAPPEREE